MMIITTRMVVKSEGKTPNIHKNSDDGRKKTIEQQSNDDDTERGDIDAAKRKPETPKNQPGKENLNYYLQVIL